MKAKNKKNKSLVPKERKSKHSFRTLLLKIFVIHRLDRNFFSSPSFLIYTQNNLKKDIRNLVLKTLLIFISLLYITSGVFSQVNFKIGYCIGFFDTQKNNSIINDYNQHNPWLEKELKNLNVMHGFNMGVRYSWSSVGFEINIANKLQKLHAEGVIPQTEENFSMDIYYKLNSYSAGLEFYFDQFGAGGTIDLSRLHINSKKTGDDDKISIINDFTYSSHFYLSYEIQAGSLMSFSLRPYIQVPWSTINIYDLEKELNPESPKPFQDFDESFMNFGLMLVFYNGNSRL